MQQTFTKLPVTQPETTQPWCMLWILTVWWKFCHQVAWSMLVSPGCIKSVGFTRLHEACWFHQVALSMLVSSHSQKMRLQHHVWCFLLSRDIRMHLHCLLQLDDSVTSLLMQVDLSGLFILDASYCNKFEQVCKEQVASSLIFTDLMQLDEAIRLAATCEQTCIKPVKAITCIKFMAFLAA